ncbi:MAG: hypothetical protein ACKV2Q_18505 [Planctomycetaceae bacterium]
MLKQHSDRVVAHFAADFQPQVSFLRKLPEVAESLVGSLKWKDWFINPNRILLVERDKGMVFSMDHRRLTWQVLGLNQWRSELTEFVTSTLEALRIFEVSDLKRIGFKVQAFLPLELSQSELMKLCFDSFYVSADDLADIIGNPYDCVVNLFGNKNNQKFALQLLPMKATEASETFRGSVGHLDKLIDNLFVDNIVRAFHSRISQADCFCFDMDVFQEEQRPSDILGFASDALHLADESCNACVARVKSLPRTS